MPQKYTITDDNIDTVRKAVEASLLPSSNGKAVYIDGKCVGAVDITPIKSKLVFGNSFCLRNAHLNKAFSVGDVVELYDDYLLHQDNVVVRYLRGDGEWTEMDVKPIRIETKDYNAISHQRYLVEDFVFSLRSNLYTNIGFAHGMMDDDETYDEEGEATQTAQESLGEKVCHDIISQVEQLLLNCVPNIPDKVESQLSTVHDISVSIVIDWKEYVDNDTAYLSGMFNGKHFEDLFDIYMGL